MASETKDVCHYCHGEGWRWEYDVFEGQDGPEEDVYEIPCKHSNPTGRKEDEPELVSRICYECNGSGVGKYGPVETSKCSRCKGRGEMLEVCDD